MAVCSGAAGAFGAAVFAAGVLGAVSVGFAVGVGFAVSAGCRGLWRTCFVVILASRIALRYVLRLRVVRCADPEGQFRKGVGGAVFPVEGVGESDVL